MNQLMEWGNHGKPLFRQNQMTIFESHFFLNILGRMNRILLLFTTKPSHWDSLPYGGCQLAAFEPGPQLICRVVVSIGYLSFICLFISPCVLATTPFVCFQHVPFVCISTLTLGPCQMGYKWTNKNGSCLGRPTLIQTILSYVILVVKYCFLGQYP